MTQPEGSFKTRDGEALRVILSCTGVAIINRGIESFSRECFDGLKKTPDLDLYLIKGRGESTSREIRVPVLPRDSAVIERIGKLAGRNGYVVEQLSSYPGVVKQIKKICPHVVFTSDSNLMFQLYKRRRKIGVPFRILFSNGGPCHPPFIRRDHVQQVAPFYLHEALEAGEPKEKHSLVPYGINVSSDDIILSEENTKQLRQKLNLPVDRKIVISVGWISKTHKRMHYTVSEVAQLSEPRPYLVMLGHQDESSREILEQAKDKLGSDGFTARTVPYAQVSDYYLASDMFALSSLREGFGRVYLEALMHGLPVAAHHHPVMQYVLGDHGLLGDFEQPGALAKLLAEELSKPADPGQAVARREAVRERFDWRNLAQSYMEMFRKAAAMPLPKG